MLVSNYLIIDIIACKDQR